MKRAILVLVASTTLVAGSHSLRAQAEKKPIEKSEAAALDALTRRIDEQNTKIDALTQHVLKIEQEMSEAHTPVMVGEPTPTAPVAATPVVAVAVAGGANTHTVARGETLTAIAKMYKVSVEDLEKTNHIANDRKLQIGQILTIPNTPSPSPSPSAK